MPASKLYEKLLAVMGAIEGVEKKGTGTDSDSDDQYSYVKAVHVLIAVRKELIKQKLFIVPSVERVDHWVNEGGRQRNGTTVWVKFRAVDAEAADPGQGGSFVEFTGYGEGVDTGDKAGYKALTGCLKYALRMLFLIPDELMNGSDPEADPHGSAREESILEVKKKRGETLSEVAHQATQFISQADRIKLFKIAEAANPEMQSEAVEKMVIDRIKAMGLESSKDLTNAQFDKLCDEFSKQKPSRSKK